MTVNAIKAVSSKNSGNEFLSLNMDIINEIPKRLDAKSLNALKCTCRNWSEKLRAFQNELRPQELIDNIETNYPNLRRLSLPNLAEGETGEQLLVMLKKINNLTILTLSNLSFQNPSRWKDHVDNPFLKALSEIPGLQSLRELNLGCCTNANYEGLQTFTNFKSLKKLSVCMHHPAMQNCKLPSFPFAIKIDIHSLWCFTNRNEELKRLYSLADIYGGRSEFDRSINLRLNRDQTNIVDLHKNMLNVDEYATKLVENGMGYELSHDKLWSDLSIQDQQPKVEESDEEAFIRELRPFV